MHRPIFGHSFAVLVAPILLLVLAFYFLNKKKTNVRRNAEDADPGASGSKIVLKESESSEFSSSPTETSNGASIGNNYEAFLTFRGSDTRYSFTDHLYHRLCDAGIHTFRDNEELRQGEEIGPDLLAAIKNSKILIPILSVNYGESKWCLEELVQIMECKKNKTGQIVLPVFYKVAPADVRHQKGSFGQAFHERERREHERHSNSKILGKWKQALREVANLNGREADGSEVELIKSVVQQVLLELKKKFELVIPENLVGIGTHVNKVMEFVNNNSHAALFVGIHGMGGIGKTTLAKTIYNMLSDKFDYRSFIADTRESCKRYGFEYLQNQLISNILKKDHKVSNKDEGIRFISSNMKGKKVLILLDDVDEDDQWEALAGNHNWFSSESVIIITSRNKSILEHAGVDCNYELEEMDKKTSSILFSRHAFRGDAPPKEFEVLTRNVVSTTGGLPLALKILGSLLCNKELGVWKDTIKKLGNVPTKKVQEKLRISYDALEYEQQQIFLDIACFFIGTDLRIASYMWDACDFYPKEGIAVLSSMSLVKVGENHKLQMHDQLRDLGWQIVRLEAKNKLRNYSRLWDSKEVSQLLKEDEGTKEIEAIRLGKYCSFSYWGKTEQDGYVFTGEQLEKLRNLRFLEASGAHFSGDFENSIKKIKWLRWQYCPSTFEANNFYTKELVVLGLAKSEISYKWQGWRFIMMAKELKYLDLSNCGFLEKPSFFSAFEKLEVLILSGCGSIEQIDSSIGNMKSLVHLDLSNCSMLKGLPVEVGKLEALEQLLLRGSGIRQLPDNIGDLQNLEALDISLTQIEELPNDIGRLRKLRELNASLCRELRETPESIHNLSSLQHLHLDFCEKLQSLSVLPSSLKSLHVTCGSCRLEAFSNQTQLKELQLPGCEFLECIGEPPSIPSEESLNTPSDLEILKLQRCFLLKILDVSQFNHMRELNVNGCCKIDEIRGLDKLEYLERLYISSCAWIKRLKLPKSRRVKRLHVGFCHNLVEIRDLVTLEEIHVSNCNSIERLDLTNCEGLKILYVDCENLVEIQGLNRKVALESIQISGCRSIERLDLTKSKGLKKLHAISCKNLSKIQGLNRKVALEDIHIFGCCSIERLDLTNSEGLKVLRVGTCKNLSEIQGLHKLKFLKLLDMSGCTSFGILPDLCCFDTLDTLAINYGDDLHDIDSLWRFPSCKSLWIDDDKSLAEFLNLPKFCNLQTLVLSCFHELREISGLEKSTSLKNMAIFGCSSIEILPDLSSCTNLVSLVVQDCEKLTELRGLEKLEQLIHLDISGCKSLKPIPELSRAKIYWNYELGRWRLYNAMRVLSYY